uniref:hypothetical protein n=1 Tax=Lentilactobacillus hilgardii TaxID=1588 RepID=UPI00403F0AEE
MQNNISSNLHLVPDHPRPYISSGENSSFLTSSHHGGYNSGNGGGGNMDNHVTHRELDKATESLQKDIRISQESIENILAKQNLTIETLGDKLDLITKRMDNFPDKDWVKNSIYEDQELRK